MIAVATLLAGVRYVREHRVILGAMSLDLFAVLLGGATALLPAVARDILHTGPWGLGILRSAPALGAGLAALYALMPPEAWALDLPAREVFARAAGSVEVIGPLLGDAVRAEAAALGMISVSASPTMKTTKEVRDGWADRVSKTVAPNLPWVRGVLVRYMDSNLPTRDELLTLAMREQYRKVFTHIVNSLRAVRP